MAILARGVKLSDFASASAQEKSRQIERLSQEALNPTVEQIKRQIEDIDTKIRNFERQYEMPSEVMRQSLIDGRMKETAEICSWLMFLKIRKRFDACSNETSAQQT